MHLAPLVRDLAVILGVAGLVSLVFTRIRQPVVLGYLVAGMIVGPHTPPYSFISDLPNIRVWAELGVIFLMFSLGLEFSFRKLARVGVSAGFTAGLEVFFMMGVGYGIGKLLGWATTDSLFLGAMLAISSTTIILKAFEELNLRTKRFAEMVFGILIVEDLFAILLLVAFTAMASNEGVSAFFVLSAAAKLALVVGSWFLIGYFAVPRLTRFVTRHGGKDEMLTILAVALCLGLAVFAASFEYSVALGAFIMGSILAETTEARRIEELMHPLRSIFAAVFFVSVGMLMDPRLFWEHRWPILVITLATVAGKILSTGLGAFLTGQSIRVSTQVGFSLAQIGEFSFIIAGLGLALGMTSDFIYPIGVAVSLITTLTTPFLIRVSKPLGMMLEEKLPKSFLRAQARYAAWLSERQGDLARRREFSGNLFRWAANAIVVSLAFILISNLLLPLLQEVIASQALRSVAAWAIAAAAAAPFLWAMFTAFSRSRSTDPSRTLLVLASRLITLALVGLLSTQFFATKIALLATSVVLLAFSVLFYRKIESSYEWFERNFLSTFENQPERARFRAADQEMPPLAPWDAHLVRIRVHPNADIAGKRLSEAKLRNRHGLNVVAIRRGNREIVSPNPDDLVFPGDELLVLSTDEKIEAARVLLEEPASEYRSLVTSGYALRSVLLPREGAWVAGKSIRNSGIRERFGAMVVGIERGQSRIMNPDSDLALEAGDRLWIVGAAESAQALEQALSQGQNPSANSSPEKS